MFHNNVKMVSDFLKACNNPGKKKKGKFCFKSNLVPFSYFWSIVYESSLR